MLPRYLPLILLCSHAWGAFQPTLCGPLTALMAPRDTTTPLTDVHWNLIDQVLIDNGVTPTTQPSENNRLLAAAYEAKGFTPMGFLNKIIREEPTLRDLATALRDEIVSTGKTVVWSPGSRNYSSPPTKKIFITPATTTALGRTGISFFLVMLRHEHTHGIQFRNATFYRGMSYADFAAANYGYVVGDEIRAMTAGAMLERELIQRGWPVLDAGGYHQFIRDTAATADNDWSFLTAVWLDLAQHGYQDEHWPNALTQLHTGLTIEAEGKYLVRLVGEQDIPVTEKIQQVEAGIQGCPYQDGLIATLERNFNNPWTDPQERRRQLEFLPFWTARMHP